MYPRTPQSAVPPSTALQSIGGKGLAGRRGAALSDLPAWAVSPFASIARPLMQAPLFYLLQLVAPAKVAGLEELEDLDGPVLFVANHTSHFDTPTLLRALPTRWRRRVGVLAAADYFFANGWLGAGVTLLFNALPFSRSASPTLVRRSLEDCALLLDGGWSLLMYPEGTRSVTGELAPFRGGVGLLAVRLGVPVVPIYIEGLSRVLPKGSRIPRPNRVQVRLGQPLLFSPDTSYSFATAAIEEAVRSLSAEL